MVIAYDGVPVTTHAPRQMFLLVATTLLTLVSACIGLRLLPALMLPPAALGFALAVLALPPLLAAGGTLARARGNTRLAHRLIWGASLSLGWISSLFILTLLRELLLAACSWALTAAGFARIQSESAAAVPALALLTTLLGLVMALARPRVLRVRVPIADLPAPLEGFTIVQLSDMHIGPTLHRPYVQAVVDQVNALDADLVAITGDLVDGTVSDLAPQVAPLAQLRSRHGTFFVTGNHEYYSGASAWIEHLRSLGVRVLVNEHTVVQHGEASLIIAGVPDPTVQAFDHRLRSDPALALRGAPAQLRPRILLAHRPRSAPAAARAGFDLQLSGHTHGGQFWPWNLVIRYQEPLAIGLDRLEQLWVYTSRGTGFWGP
ncbi:MAG TPA: metallophosphoesterase, partial [Steroidobacteraceae bacterium]|nr:metallophosphoesterase [Steroidobacteraceae bacterium]